MNENNESDLNIRLIINKLESGNVKFNELNGLLISLLKYSINNSGNDKTKYLNKKIPNIINGDFNINNLIDEINDVTEVMTSFLDEHKYDNYEGGKIKDDEDDEDEDDWNNNYYNENECSSCGAKKGEETNDCCPWSD